MVTFRLPEILVHPRLYLNFRIENNATGDIRLASFPSARREICEYYRFLMKVIELFQRVILHRIHFSISFLFLVEQLLEITSFYPVFYFGLQRFIMFHLYPFVSLVYVSCNVWCVKIEPCLYLYSILFLCHNNFYVSLNSQFNP